MRDIHSRDVSTAIGEIWNKHDKEYNFKLVKCMPGRIKTVIKAREGKMRNNSNYFFYEFLRVLSSTLGYSQRVPSVWIGKKVILIKIN